MRKVRCENRVDGRMTLTYECGRWMQLAGDLVKWIIWC